MRCGVRDRMAAVRVVRSRAMPRGLAASTVARIPEESRTQKYACSVSSTYESCVTPFSTAGQGASTSGDVGVEFASRADCRSQLIHLHAQLRDVELQDLQLARDVVGALEERGDAHALPGHVRQQFIDARLRRGIELRDPCGIEVDRTRPFERAQRFFFRGGDGQQLARPALHYLTHQQIHVATKGLLLISHRRRPQLRSC